MRWALVLAAPLAVAASGPVHFARALQWTAAGAELSVLGTAPRQCSRADPASDASPAQLAAGEALFNSPALLGGQAAKADLSCAACHRNGRNNPHFQMPHLSGAPGTADVTNSFFGPSRANGRFDPVTIPDLALPGKISRAPDSPALARFIRTLVVEEFSGAEPSPAMLDALAAYVRSIGPCPAGGDATVPRRLDDQLRLIDRAVTGILAAPPGDTTMERQLIAAARRQLGLIDERYAGAGLATSRRDLLAASRELARIGADPGDAADRRQPLQKWYARWTAGPARRLRRHEAASYYDPAQLRRAFAADTAAPR